MAWLRSLGQINEDIITAFVEIFVVKPHVAIYAGWKHDVTYCFMSGRHL